MSFTEAEFSKTELYHRFKESDFLYGVERVRQIGSSALRKKFPGKETFITVDDINNVLVPLLIDEENGYDSELEGSVPEKYSSYLEIYKTIEPQKYRINSGETNHDKALKNCCRAMLTSGNKIHFLLDAIDWQKVFVKNADPRGYKSFTSAELHYVFQHWDSVKESITFYYNGKPVNLLQHVVNQGAKESCRDYLIAKNINIADLEFDNVTFANVTPLERDNSKTPEKYGFNPEPRKPSANRSRTQLVRGCDYSSSSISFSMSDENCLTPHYSNKFLARRKLRFDMEDNNSSSRNDIASLENEPEVVLSNSSDAYFLGVDQPSTPLSLKNT